MSVYTCKKCGTHENIRLTVELIPENGDTPNDVQAVWVDASCSGCGDWISVDVTSAMSDFFDYFGSNRDEGTLMLDTHAEREDE
jgi:hypothetical protein